MWAFDIQGDLIIKILFAGFLGGIVGIERDVHGHEAGLRTNMIIAMSSCLFTILSFEGFFGDVVDTSRVASQIVVGVGFLGAGALIQRPDHIRGLTTAADIWLVAALGMAVATGFYALAFITALLVAVLLPLLSPVSRWLERRGKGMRKK